MKGGEILNTNATFEAQGVVDGMTAILGGFADTLDNSLTADVWPVLTSILTALIVVVGIWYGVRAIIRAMRAPK